MVDRNSQSSKQPIKRLRCLRFSFTQRTQRNRLRCVRCVRCVWMENGLHSYAVRITQCSSVLIPTISNIVNLSLSSGHFHPILKQSIISPLLKKSTLDKEQLSNYRPISNLSLISKIIERIVKSRLTVYLSSNSLLNPHQSAYCKHHSTETALSYIHHHLINAIGSQKLSCLCLLDLSVAFDTIDHNILITRLSSWFGIHGSVLNWFKSYLSSRSFCVRLTPIPVYVVFPKVLFLVPYFSSCIPLLSVLLSLLYH